MRTRTGWIPVLAILMVMLVVTLALAGCTPADPATWMLITPEATAADVDAPDSDSAIHPVETDDAACDRHRTLATLRAAVPYDESTLYFTGRAQEGGEISYGLTLWYVDPEIPSEGAIDDVEAVVLDTVNRTAAVVQDTLASDACLQDLFDQLTLIVVDSAYNSWYAGALPIADVLADPVMDALLSSPEMLLPETWPEAAGELSNGSCTWAEATASMEVCTGENGGCLYALIEQMGPIAIAQTRLPMPLDEWPADRDQDMQTAEAAMAGLDCLYPPAFSKVMNFVTEDGALLFAGEWSGDASQVSYWAPVTAAAPDEAGKVEEPEAEQETEAQGKGVEKEARQSATPGPATDVADLRDLADRASAANAWLMAYMVQSDDRVELYATDFIHDPGRNFRLVFGGEGIPIQPQWSPDGQRIFFYYLPNPAMNIVSLWVIDLADQTIRTISDDSLAAFAQFTWSPDGGYIAYPGRQRDGMAAADIYRIDVTTGESVNLTESPTQDYQPDWSPDGASIVFVSDRDEPGVDALWLMAADGSDAQRLTDAGPLTDVLPAWSPDGGEIAFFRRGTDPDRTQVNGLWAIAPGGSGERLIAESTDLSTLEAVDRRWPPLESPAWSQDGEWLAFMQRTPAGETDLFIVPAAGGEPVLVSGLPGVEYDAGWMPTGAAITFTYEAPDDSHRIYMVRRDGSDLRPVFKDEVPLPWAQNVMLGDWAPHVQR